MKRSLKYTALLLSLILLLLPLSACSEEDNSPDEGEKIVGSAGEYDILYDELRFVTLTYKKLLDIDYGDGDAANGTIWDDEDTAQRYKKTLEDKVYAMLEENYRVLAACSVYGIGRDVLESEEIQSRVEAQYKSAIATFSSKEAFLADMESNFMTERLYRLYLARDFMKYKLRDAVLLDEDAEVIRDQDAFYKWIRNGNGVYVQHILLRNDEGEVVESNRIIAEEVSNAIKDGEYTIEDYVGTQINDDLTNAAPYYLIKGLYDEALTDAALRLYADGDVTDAIETDDGYYVIQRMEEPKGDLEGRISDLYDTYLWTAIGSTASDADAEITLNEYGKSIDLTKIN